MKRFNASVRKRREQLSANKAVDHILNHLSQHLDVLEKDFERYEKEKDTERAWLTAHRKNWVEQMIFWIGRNV